MCAFSVWLCFLSLVILVYFCDGCKVFEKVVDSVYRFGTCILDIMALKCTYMYMYWIILEPVV